MANSFRLLKIFKKKTSTKKNFSLPSLCCSIQPVKQIRSNQETQHKTV
jgi:hypothetical protein